MTGNIGPNPLSYMGSPEATEEVLGVVEFATIAETTAGILTDKAVTPAGVAAVAIAGAPDASTSQKGIIEIATNGEAALKAATNLALVPSNIPSIMSSPGSIGNTTPSTGAFTDFSASGTFALTGDDVQVSEGGTGRSTLTAGAILYGDTANPVALLAIGTANQLLQVNAGATAPEWTDNVDVQGTFEVQGVSTFQDTVDFNGAVNINASMVVDSITIDNLTIDADTVSTTGSDLTLESTDMSVIINSVEDTAGAIFLHANGGTSETIQIRADQGTGAASVELLSDVGGVTLTAGLGTADAINLNTTNAAGGIDVDAGTGGININTTGALSLTADAASQLRVDGAGIDLTVTSVGGSVLVESTEDAALAIRLHANGGTSETIQIHADQGTGVASVGLLSDVGGITLRATGLASADAINLEAPAGGVDIDGALQVNIDSAQAAATAVRIFASNAAGGIDIDSGTGGITLDSTAGISIDAATASNLTVTGAAQDLTLSSSGGSVNITATEAAGDAIVLNASNAAGGIDLLAGTGNVSVSSNLVLSSVATQIQMNGGAVTDFIGTATLNNGVITVNNTNIAAGDQIYITRQDINGSTALGDLTYTISAGASFTITSVTRADPAVTETNDDSILFYIIFRQN